MLHKDKKKVGIHFIKEKRFNSFTNNNIRKIKSAGLNVTFNIM